MTIKTKTDSNTNNVGENDMTDAKNVTDKLVSDALDGYSTSEPKAKAKAKTNARDAFVELRKKRGGAGTVRPWGSRKETSHPHNRRLTVGNSNSLEPTMDSPIANYAGFTREQWDAVLGQAFKEVERVCSDHHLDFKGELWREGLRKELSIMMQRSFMHQDAKGRRRFVSVDGRTDLDKRKA